MSTRFWEQKSLSEMTTEEWESLCDGCGRCCLNKFEDEDTGQIYFTNVCCEFFDSERCGCSNYAKRSAMMPDCLILSADKPEIFEVMPATCAYKLLHHGQALPEWHPLVSGDRQSVHHSDMSMRGKVVSEAYIHPQQMVEHIIDWISAELPATDEEPN